MEVNSEKLLIESIVVPIPLLEGDGYMKETIRVEYEWTPPRCSNCRTFDHDTDDCPKVSKPKPMSVVFLDDEGYQQPKKKHQAKGVALGKPHNYNASHQLREKKGVPVKKGSTKMVYVPVQKSKEKMDASNDDMEDRNPFSALMTGKDTGIEKEVEKGKTCAIPQGTNER